MRLVSTNGINFMEEFGSLLSSQDEVASQTTAYRTACLSEINNAKLDEAIAYIEEKLGRPMMSDFTFKAGKLIGIIRTTAYANKYQKDILNHLGLPMSIVEDFFAYYGNPAYTKNGKFIEEVPMDIEKTKESLLVAASCLGVLVDTSDITPERVSKHFEYRRATALKTLEDTPEMPAKFDE